jgi:hypothetical protein
VFIRFIWAESSPKRKDSKIYPGRVAAVLLLREAVLVLFVLDTRTTGNTSDA